MKKPLELAVELAEYGLYGAGGDEDWCQQSWGADCVEAAVLLMRPYARTLHLGKNDFDAETLKSLAQEMRAKSERLRAEEEAMIANRKTK